MKIGWFFLLCISCLFADLEPHLKKASNKGEGHSMKNIDFIYMINLDQRPEKWQLSRAQLSSFGIEPYRFSAVNGWELSLEAINSVGVKFTPFMKRGIVGTSYLLDRHFESIDGIIQNEGQIYFCHCMARGTIGIVLSHVSVLKDAYDSGYETIWVMEDDIQIIRNPHILSDLIEELDRLVGKEGWDVLFTDPDTKNQEGAYVSCTAYARRPNYTPPDTARFAQKEEISPDLRQIGARYGAYSMILRRSGMKKILDFFQSYQIFLPYDMEYTQPPDIRLFTVTEDVVATQPQAPSDNGSPNYLLNVKGVASQ